jgi:hypothetical protein
VVIGVPPPAPPVNETKETKETKQEEEAPPEAPPPPVKTAPKIAALAKDKAPTTPRPPRPVGSTLGFVAVLKSEKSSIEATKTLADLQQKYPEVLEGKSFDVQEADLSDRNLGTMYRVVVGPPGSHNAATALCTQLKAAGYVGCWVKEF